jgi:hypothetical protein
VSLSPNHVLVEVTTVRAECCDLRSADVEKPFDGAQYGSCCSASIRFEDSFIGESDSRQQFLNPLTVEKSAGGDWTSSCRSDGQHLSPVHTENSVLMRQAALYLA